MEPKQRIRYLSYVIISLGGALSLIGAYTTKFEFLIFGIVSGVLGATIIIVNHRKWFEELKMNISDRDWYFVAISHTLATVVVFSGFVILLSDFETIAQAWRSGISIWSPLSYSALIIGVFLGGILQILVQRMKSVYLFNQSLAGQLILQLVKNGTFILLLILSPATSILYACTYLTCRVCVITIIYYSSFEQNTFRTY